MQEFKKPLISLIVTCHNLGKYLPECIKSIENQSYKNFEIIIVDDFSDAETKEVIEKNYKNKNVISKFFNTSDIRVIETGKNEGQMGAFLTGLKVSRGEFVCMIDADDVLLKDYLSVLLQAHMRVSVAFVSAAQMEIDENSTIHCLNSVASPAFKNCGGVYKKLEADEIFNTDFEDFEVKKITNRECPFGAWCWNPSTSAMMRRSALEFLFLFKNVERYKTGADKFIFSFLHLIGSSATVSRPLFAYRRHGGNCSGTNPVMGDFRYLKPESVDRLIKWNKNLHFDTLDFIIKNYSYFCARLNSMNTKKLIFKIIFSFNFLTIKKALKALLYKFC